MMKYVFGAGVVCLRLFAVGASLLCTMAAHAGSYSNDFSSGVGAGVISGNAAIVSSRLRLTPNTASTYGTLLLNDLDPGRRVQSFTATFNLIIDGHGVADTADGLSVNFANPATYPGGYQLYELGAGTNGLQARFQTYVSRYTALGVNGIGPQFTYYTTNMTDGSTQPVTLTYNKKTGATLTYRTNTTSIAATQLVALGFSGPLPGFRLLIGARCGGNPEDHIIDDLVVTTVPAGTNAALTNLTLSAGALSTGFSAATTNYSATVPNSSSNITITPFAADTNGTITVNGTNVVSGSSSGAIALSSGSNTITVAVTAEDGTTSNSYRITIVRNTNATLANLTASVGTLAPAFASGTTNYTLLNVASNVLTVSLTPTVADSNATVTVNGTPVASGSPSGNLSLFGGTNTFFVVVKAGDGTTLRTYTVEVPLLIGRHFVAPGSPSPAAPYTNWVTAAHTIQEAISVAVAGEQVIVSNGTYSTGGAVVHGAMTNRVAIYDGITVRSANGPAVTTIVGAGPPGDAAVRCIYVGNNAVLSGFTLTNGATRAGGDAFTEQNGGGAWCASSGMLLNCVLTGNTAQNLGGGVFAGTLSDCVLSGNSAAGGGGAYGATLNRCRVTGNSVINHGAGARNCTLNNCLVTGNAAGEYGGGVFSDNPGDSVVNNSTITANSAVSGAGGSYQSVLNNCIVYFNTAPVDVNFIIVDVFSNSCTTPDPGGTGNITNDPLFIATNDFHLSAGSPCINSGDNSSVFGSTDLDGRPRIAGTVDMGAYEMQPFMAVLGTNVAVVANGDASPDAADGTDFGFALAPTTTVMRTFGITNGGNFPLTISGVATSGPASSDFTILSFPATVSAGAVSSLVIRFNPTTGGAKNATITLANNDATNFSYAFAVKGTSHLPVTRYVWTNSPFPAAPYTAWTNAARTIQDAVDAAQIGDLILVTNGVHAAGGRAVAGSMTNRAAIDRPIVVRSVNGPAVTVIQGAGPSGNAAVRCAYVGSNAVLAGFTLTNGATRSAGDITTEQSGGGAWCEASGVISNCIIAGNVAQNGGGVYGGTMNNCLLAGNTATGGNGGGVASGTLNNCTLSGNASVSSGGGAYLSSLSNCIAYYNAAPVAPNVSGGTNLFTCTTPLQSGAGNITNEPQFVATNDYHLNINSPAVDAGNNAGVAGTTDLDGNPRILNGTVDMGAYETAVPNIAVQGTNNALIANGSASPIVTDGTDFLWTNLVGATITRTFTITNPGSAALVISGVTTSGPGAPDFTILSFPSIVPVGGRSNLVIRFDPSVVGVRTAVVAIANNSRAATSNYTFAVQGGGNIPGTRYVATNSPAPAAPYTNWQTAARTIQDAVDWTYSGDRVVVTDGVYSVGGRVHSNFLLTNRVYIASDITIESVNGPLVTTIQGAKDPITLSNGNAAVRGVFVRNVSAVVSGFTISGGATRTNSVDETDLSSGGVACQGNVPVLTNCVITGNSGVFKGGGVYMGTYYNCTISSNFSGNVGGGAWNATLKNCTVFGNRTAFGGFGGGVFSGALSNCLVAGNSAQQGAGAYSATLHNCILSGNTANFLGGGAIGSTLNNCTVVSNSAVSSGGGVYDGTVLNCIVYFNTAGSGPNHFQSTSLTVAYSCTTPHPGGTGNFTNQPLFVATNDYHLSAGSPCRDAGLNAYAVGSVDLDGSNRIVNIGVDLGAYEFQTGAPADYDNDGLPSWWEAKNGLPVANAINATTSSDGDWMTDLEEYFADTNPTDSNSLFPPVTFTNTAQNTVNFLITPTSTGRIYAIRWSTNLLAAPQSWQLIGTEQTGTAGTLTFTITNDIPQRTYRTGVRLP